MGSNCQVLGKRVWAPLLALLTVGIRIVFKGSKPVGKVRYGFGEKVVLSPCAEVPGPPSTWGQEALGASGMVTVIPNTVVLMQGTGRPGSSSQLEKHKCAHRDLESKRKMAATIIRETLSLRLLGTVFNPSMPTPTHPHSIIHTPSSGPCSTVITLRVHLQTFLPLGHAASPTHVVQALPSRDTRLSILSFQQGLLASLHQHSPGKSCLYFCLSPCLQPLHPGF